MLILQAWKKRWFVLRSGRLTGDPDVLEYYKNDHAKKPIRVIDLNLCEQVSFLNKLKVNPQGELVMFSHALYLFFLSCVIFTSAFD